MAHLKLLLLALEQINRKTCMEPDSLSFQSLLDAFKFIFCHMEDFFGTYTLLKQI